MSRTIGVIAGSLRKESFSKKLARTIIDMAPDGVEFKWIAIDELPLYNQDFDDHGPLPPSYVTFREEIQGLDGVIFITPEYNRSMSSVLKNAVDVGSRPYGKNSWDGKSGLVISNSPGNLAGFGAHHHLRQSLVCVNVNVLAQPEIYLANVAQYFDEQGQMTDDSVKGFLQKAIDAYLDFTERLK